MLDNGKVAQGSCSIMEVLDEQSEAHRLLLTKAPRLLSVFECVWSWDRDTLTTFYLTDADLCSTADFSTYRLQYCASHNTGLVRELSSVEEN